jgi:malate synthase
MANAELTEVGKIVGEPIPGIDRLLTTEAQAFLASLHKEFNHTRKNLLALPDFLSDTARLRQLDWQVAPAPKDLLDRRVEITGPVERKMMINALNSGAKVFMADFEDALSPTWPNVIEGQLNVIEAVRRELSFTSPEGKEYKLKEQLATLVIRPRGWHLVERHFLVGGEPISASLFDFGLFFFHNAKELIARQSGPYFYLPKLESHLEARLWNEVFNFAQEALQIPKGTIRATVLIETILGAFEMEEILYELRDHAAGLNAGRWDYIFSMIKKCRKHPQFVLPDRAQVTMAVPFMRAYAQLLVKTCHKRGAHAIGGMAAFIPSRKDQQINEVAFSKVREDKLREAGDGFDGTWVAHPDLVSVAKAVFDDLLKDKPNQKDRQREDLTVTASDILSTTIAGSAVTRAGVSSNIDVALQYIESWLRGVGAAGIHNLMEDAATAEIARAQLWQWIWNQTKLTDGTSVSTELYQELKNDLMQRLQQSFGDTHHRFNEAAEILDKLVLSREFADFLTIAAYDYLD